MKSWRAWGYPRYERVLAEDFSTLIRFKRLRRSRGKIALLH